jgi:hypothetical protein
MANYPNNPVPSMVSGAEIIDPVWAYSVDQGYEVRRAKHSRPRHRWTLEYRGLKTQDMRQIRDFVHFARLSQLDFAWQHPTAQDLVLISPTTPVTMGGYHGLATGQWVIIYGSPNPSLNNQAWQVTRYDVLNCFLNNTTAAGIAGNANMQLYVPHMKIVAAEDTFPAPVTHRGPEQVRADVAYPGYYAYTVTLEELF